MFSQANIDSFKLLLQSKSWCDVENYLHQIDVENAMVSFNKTILTALNETCPEKFVRMKT